MKVLITEYLRIDLDTEKWECRNCDHPSARPRANYKEGLLVYHRDPTRDPSPLLDTKKYAKTFSPDPKWCAILEYYCPELRHADRGRIHRPRPPPVRDLELDIDALKVQWAKRKEEKVHIAAGDPPARPPHSPQPSQSR
jgi:acetone carboxylase gamma subunit